MNEMNKQKFSEFLQTQHKNGQPYSKEEADKIAQYAFAAPCLMCGNPETIMFAIYEPSDDGRKELGLAPAEGKIFTYMLCDRHALPRFSSIEIENEIHRQFRALN